MERHGLPGVAVLKIITKHFKTLLFEVQINLKIKHDKMSAEAKTICHQYKLFLTQTLSHKHCHTNTFCSVTSLLSKSSLRMFVLKDDKLYLYKLLQYTLVAVSETKILILTELQNSNVRLDLYG